ncbi:hypothetical protein Vretimale_19158 [Volvox reticuliferus]|uniref:SAC domain-containing protein n=1 Tax=Volvox reticuliferus TaxID=1737510 RepID=A0A8J4M015_9CHLO|nr:hypothetical protein Vretimale_19158 [Volvox reticuliferus]
MRDPDPEVTGKREGGLFPSMFCSPILFPRTTTDGGPQGHTAGFAETEVVLTVWQPEENDLASATATAAASDTDTAATATATATAASPSSTANPKQDSQQQQQQPQQRLGETGDKGKGSDAPGETGPKGGCSPRSGSVAVSDSSTCVRKRTWVAVTSYVIARGSAPLFWAAPPDMRLCPAPRGPEDPVLHSGPFTRHVDWLHAAYGRTLLLLNIIFGSNERQQLRLHDALKQQVDAYCARVRDQRRKQQQQQLQVESRNEHQATSREGEDIATGEGRGEDGDTSGAAAVAVASAGSATAPGAVSGRSTNNPEVASSLSLVGLLLRSGELSELASCGAAAAHLEREVAEAARRIGAFVSLDELEMTVMQQPSTAATNANGTRTAATSTATKTTTANSPMVASDPQPQPQPQSLRGRSMTRCVGRQVCCLQKGLLRVSSASTVSAGGAKTRGGEARGASFPAFRTAYISTQNVSRNEFLLKPPFLPPPHHHPRTHPSSPNCTSHSTSLSSRRASRLFPKSSQAQDQPQEVTASPNRNPNPRAQQPSAPTPGGCCEEVDLAQHALVLPVLAEALVAMGAMDDPGDMGVAHGSVIHALAQLWSHMADVLSDQTLGTASHAGRVLRAAAAAMEPPSLARWVVKGLWDKILSVGDTASRYYYSNFTDARRQDALDLSSGVFKMSSPPAELPRRKPPSTTTLQLGILLVLAATIQAVVLAFKRSVGLKELGTGVLGPAALGVALLLEVLRQGTAYVEQPLLQRTGLYPWAQ